MEPLESVGWVAFALGALVGALVVALLAHATAPQGCAEDEAAVWVDTGHDACVALDDMWYDNKTRTVHWNVSDEREM